MLDDAILNTLREYSKRITENVQLKLYHGHHEKRSELETMLKQVASISDKIDFVHAETAFQVREGLTFELLRNGEKSGVLFSGIPGGHEFNSFILALLQVGGVDSKLDAGVQNQVKAIQSDLQFETIISLDCHVCPDVVQTLNQFAILNPKISNEMIDGNMHPEFMAERQVQGVPTVFLNKKPFASGQITATQLLEKLKSQVEMAEVAQVLDDKVYDTVVVGGGPAASAAAIYTARKGLAVALIAEKLGGQVNDTQGIENLISVPKTTGPELAKNLAQHLADYPVAIKQEVRVDHVRIESELKLIELSSGEILQAKTVIIATGAKWRELGVEGEKENVGNGVAFCPHCDGPFFKGKDVVVVGGGNSGVEAALDLSGIVKSVTVIEYMDEMKADRVLIDQLEQTQNISAMTGIETKSIKAGTSGVTGMVLKKRSSGEEFTHKTDGVFVQIGLIPNSLFVQDLVETTARGEIVINEKCETNVAGIYACGDVTTVPYKQIVVAMGEGAKAGLTAFEYLLTAQG